MKLLDGELSEEEKRTYEQHVKGCETCASELRELGRIVQFTNELHLRKPDEEFWTNYWRSLYRRLERGTGFLLLIAGLIVVAGWGVFEAVTSPEFFTVKGISITVILLGLVIIFLSVVRERYHESKDDPYKEVNQ
jgi:anti-sigma factor RsiW